MEIPTVDIVYLFAECVVGLLSLYGNTLVILPILRFHSLHTSSNYFVASLAVADILVGLFVPPFVIVTQLGLPRNFHGCVALYSVIILLTTTPVLSLVDITVDRFMAIRFPLQYRSMMSPSRALFLVWVTWAVAIAIGSIPNMGWHLDPEGFDNCNFHQTIDRTFIVYLLFFGIELPLFVAMLVIYLSIFLIARRRQERMMNRFFTTKQEQHNARRRWREVRGAQGLAFVIILYAVCWLPINIFNAIYVMVPHINLPIEWVLTAVVLSHANSVANPLLYAFANEKFRVGMIYFLYCGTKKRDLIRVPKISTVQNVPRTATGTTSPIRIYSLSSLGTSDTSLRNAPMPMADDGVATISLQDVRTLKTAARRDSSAVDLTPSVNILKPSHSCSTGTQKAAELSPIHVDADVQQSKEDLLGQTNEKIKTAARKVSSGVDLIPFIEILKPSHSSRLGTPEAADLSPALSDADVQQTKQGVSRQTSRRLSAAQCFASQSDVAAVTNITEEGAQDVNTVFTRHYPAAN